MVGLSASANTTNQYQARVLFCLPVQDDAAIVERCIRDTGAIPALCSDMNALCERISGGVDVLVVSEEALGATGLHTLQTELSNQPEWSEVPVLLLVTGRDASLVGTEARQRLEGVMLFDKPLCIPLFEATLQMALRTRSRQRQLRDLLEERHRLNTELERRLEALRRSEERYRRLYDSNIIGIVTAGPDRIYDANELFLQLIGYSCEEFERQPVSWKELTSPEYLAKDESALDELIQTGRCKPYEIELVRRDGARVPVMIGTVLLERDPILWLCCVLDLTERRQLEHRVLQAQKLESVGLLAGGVAHDFNNLLTGILGNASLVIGDLQPAAAERIQDVINSAKRAADLTHQLLAYSGKGQFVVRDLDIAATMNEISGLVEFSIPKSVQLSVMVQRRLPAVRMDPGQLQQILMNLVINAGEAIGEGNSGRITVATSMIDIEESFIDAIGEQICRGRYVAIEVSDTGPGIDPDARSRIFDPFFTTKFTGRGLGLAAVAGILRSLKGGMTVETTPGAGTTFRVLLPVANHKAQPERPQPATIDRGTVLVVDDEAFVRDFISTVLRRRGYRVFLASDGREALSVFEREHNAIDAIVLDVVMPVMGGNELLPKVLELQPNLKVLLTSGYSEEEARRLCAEFPGAVFIQKPYMAEQIAKAVNDLFGVAG